MRREVTSKHYAEVFGSDIGQAVLEDILLSAFVYKINRPSEVIDPNKSVFCDGARSLALAIKEKVEDGHRPLPPTPATAHTMADPRRS